MAGSLRDYMQSIVAETAKKTAEAITDDLKRAGPYWTGDFEKAWVVRPGFVNIAKEGVGRDISQGFPARKTPSYTKAAIPPVQPASSVELTIGNTSTYREVAMDLLPDLPRVFRDDGTPKNITADQDWYIKYRQAGGLTKSINRGIAEAAKDPKLVKYKGDVEVKVR